MPICFKCNLTLPSIHILRHHFKFCLALSHGRKVVNEYRCAESDKCFKSFSAWSSFRSHLIKIHLCPILSTNGIAAKDPASNIQAEGNISLEQSDSSETFHDDLMDSSQDCKLNTAEILEDACLEFAAKLYANHKLPRSHAVEIMKETSDLLSFMLDIVKPSIRNIVKGKCDEETTSCIEQRLDYLVKPFVKMSSQYLFLKLLKAKDHFISKHTSVIGFQTDHVRYKGKILKKIVDVTAKFIPMRVVLQKIFSLPRVLVSVQAYVEKLNSDTEILENFVQGKLWRRKVKNHFQGKIVFPIFLYFDDFEVGNPLGSHAGINKLGGIYYTIPCFPPEVQSLLDNIFVAGLFYSSDRAIFTNRIIFKPVIDEINFLQTEGIVVNTENGPVQLYFALGLILGDNLGLNQILGFQESFSAYHSCRFCPIDKFQLQYDTSGVALRTVEMYDADVEAANPRDTGVKEKSVWDNVQFFRTCENFAVDFLHDGPEGVLKKIMGLIVHYFSFTLKSTVDAGFLTVLNDRLNCFDYYHNCIKNKPPLVSSEEAKEKTLKMYASEMQGFVLIFSMLVGDIVPHDDDVWQLYISVRKFCDIVLTRKLPKVWVVSLKDCARELYEKFLKVFPEESITHKFHLIVAHYMTVLEESGPIPNMSTYRFESKHKRKKTEANATSSRKNIIDTLAHKELLVLSYRFLLGFGFSPNVAYGQSTLAKLSKQTGFNQFGKNCPRSFTTKMCKKMNWAKINGITYRNGSCLVIGTDVTDEVVPIFALIDSLFLNDDSEILFVCKMLYTVDFENNFHAYVVQETGVYTCILLSELMTPFPALISFLDRRLFVTLKHAL